MEKMVDSKLVLRCDKQNKILPKYPFFGDCSRPSFASICCHVYFVADAVDFVVGDKAEDGDGSCHCKFVIKIVSWKICKGQLISKCLFGVFNSPKNCTKTVWLEVP